MKNIEYEKIFLDETKKGKKIKKENYLKEGKFPIIDQGREKIAGYCNKEDGIYTEQPVIIFGDHTRILKYIDFPFFLGADGVKILKVKNKNFLVKYLYYALLNYHIPNTGYNRHFKWLKNFKIKEIELQKQEKIILTLDKINNILKKQKEQLELLENLKKSQFFELFGDPIKNEKGWRIEKWKNLFKIQTGKLNSNAMVEGGKYPFFTCAKEIFSIDKYYFDCEALILAGNNADGIYDVKYYNGKFNAYQRTYVINLINKEYNYIFFKFLLESKLKYLKEISKGSSTRYLTMSILSNLKFILPETSLQNKFATKIEAIQKLKFEIEKSLKETENLYNSLMQKFFSNK